MFRVIKPCDRANVGDIVYLQSGYDYGLSSDDTRMTGIEHKTYTYNPDGDYPGFTIPVECVEKICPTENKKEAGYQAALWKIINLLKNENDELTITGGGQIVRRSTLSGDGLLTTISEPLAVAELAKRAIV